MNMITLYHLGITMQNKINNTLVHCLISILMLLKGIHVETEQRHGRLRLLDLLQWVPLIVTRISGRSISKTLKDDLLEGRVGINL